MARTKQTSYHSGRSSYDRATFRGAGGQSSGNKWWNKSSNWGWNKKRRQSWGSSQGTSGRYRSWSHWDEDIMDNETLERILGLGHSSSQAGQSTVPAYSQEVVVGEEEEEQDEMGHDDLDDEICFGTVRGNIVGLQYYTGTVNRNEMVALEREPQNRFDINAIRVKNVGNIQVGHIKRELARPLAYIIDKDLARLEGVVPFGATNMYSMPVELTLWGKQEKQKAAIEKLKFHGYYLTGGTKPSSETTQAGMESFSAAAIESRRTFLTPAEVKGELDKLFENIKEGDKTSLAEPAEGICTQLYPHQKQALNWMIRRENSSTLPPFWQERNKRYFNSVLNYTSDKKPESVRGGILADDMGLGKTLEMITLIVTNFVDNKPIAVPVQGLVRQSKHEKLALQKSRMLPTAESVSRIHTKNVQLKIEKGTPSQNMPLGRLPVLGSISNPTNIETPLLPELPDEDDLTSPDVSDDDGDLDSIPSVDEKTMLKKDDPNFSPALSTMKTKVKENITPRVSARPKRSAKRPVRYEFDSEDELNDEETPQKRVKDNAGRGKGKAAVKGKTIVKKSKVRKCLTESNNKDNLQVEKVEDKGVTVVFDVPDAAPVTTPSIVDKGNQLSVTAEQKLETENATENSWRCVEVVKIESENKYVLPAVTPAQSDSLHEFKKYENLQPEVAELPDLPTYSLKSQADTTAWGYTCSDSETVVPSDYTKPGIREVGATTGRTPTKGPRCTLIVCPLSVLSNWLNQLDDHIHRNVHLNIYLYYGPSRTKDSRQIENQDIVITTYSTLSADFKKGERNPMKKVKWLRIVLDEGHTIKNPNAQQTKAILELEAERKWVITGTPIQNSMKDLWSLINYLKVNPFTDKQWWRRTIERPLEKGNESALKRIQHLMGHLALRRTKNQEVNGKPLVQLPARNVYLEHVKLSEEERGVYEAMQHEGKLIVSKYFKQGTLLHHYGDVLAILMRLRQLCCHPYLVAKAAKAVKDTIAEIEQNDGVVNDALREKLIGTLIMVLSSGTDEECAICLDSLKSPVITHCAHVFCRPCIEAVISNERLQPKCPLCRGAIETGKLLEVPPEELQQGDIEGDSVNPETWKSSSKTDALMNALLTLRSEDGQIKSIIVSQFTSLLTLLEIPLRANGFSFVRLNGTMSTKARTKAIEEFSDPSHNSPTIILLSLKAGGVGINLTAASRVFLMDPAWNPASEEQCFDRCHRLGQTNDVIITKFIVDDSVEERMMELQEKKRLLMQGAFGQKQTAEQKRQSRIKDIKTLLNL